MNDERCAGFIMNGFVLLAILVFCSINVYSYSSLELDKTIFAPGEEIAVHFSVGDRVAPSAWIGIIPSRVPHGSEAENDKNDITYQYLQGKPSGTLIFIAPSNIGSYDFRMHDTDDNGREIASVSFQVGGTTGTLWLDKAIFGAGEEITVHFTAGPGFAENAWIGIIPSSAPHGSEAENDKYDISYQYLQGKSSGTLIFKAPSQAGMYDFRMHDTDNNGKEITSVSFQVSL
jgi:hypothetical protein